MHLFCNKKKRMKARKIKLKISEQYDELTIQLKIV